MIPSETPPLKDRVNEVVRKYIDGYLATWSKPKKEKIIQDPIHGTIVIKPHELLFLDSPLLQRLRRIYQTSSSLWTYPTSHHSRFEHSLGVMSMVERMVRAMESKKKIEEDDIRLLRITGLLHDLGHGPFSHLSEDIFREFPEDPLFNEVNDLQKQDPFSLKKSKAAEILTYYIIMSDSFKNMIKKSFEIGGIGINPDTAQKQMAHMILGNVEGVIPPEKTFISEMISSAVDADKLDYIVRDNHYTGLGLSLDVQRLLYALTVVEESGKLHLAINMKGLVPLEQIIVSKAFLTTSLYHHQKVRATDCMVKGLLEIGIEEKATVADAPLSDPVSFLEITDFDLLSPDGKPKKYQDQVRWLLNRDIPKRMLCIYNETIAEEKGQKYKLEIVREKFRNECTKSYRQRIADKCGEATKGLIWIDFPKPLNFAEAENFRIVFGEDIPPKKLNEVFPLPAWQENYSKNLYRGYIFAPMAYKDIVKEEAKKILGEKPFELKLKPLAEKLCD